MKTKFLSLLAAGSLALMMQACGDDNGSSPVEFDDEQSSCSAADDDSSSSSVVEEKSSDSKDDASSDSKTEGSSDSESEGSSDSSEENSSDSGENTGSEEEVSIDLSKVSGFVMTSNYMVGGLRWFENGKLSKNSVAFGGDAKIVKAGDQYVVLDRKNGASTMAILNKSSKAAEYQTNLYDEAAVENPQDVVFYNDEYWVTSESGVSSFFVDNGSLVPNSFIDLSEYASQEGQEANVIDLEISHDTLFVLMQRYVAEGYSITFPNKGILALFKISYEAPDEAVYLEKSDALASIELATVNPMTIKLVNGEVFVGTHATYNAARGADADANRGIEKVNVKAGTSSMFVSGEKLGGGVIAMDVDYANSIAYVSVRGESYGHGSVAVVNLKNGDVKAVDGIDGSDGGLAFDSKSGILFVGIQAIMNADWSEVVAPAALYAYDGKVVSKVEYADEATMPPYNIVF